MRSQTFDRVATFSSPLYTYLTSETHTWVVMNLLELYSSSWASLPTTQLCCTNLFWEWRFTILLTPSCMIVFIKHYSHSSQHREIWLQIFSISKLKFFREEISLVMFTTGPFLMHLYKYTFAYDKRIHINIFLTCYGCMTLQLFIQPAIYNLSGVRFSVELWFRIT